MFYRLDKDQSQTVSRAELIELSDEDKTMMYGCNVVGNPLDIFDALDGDGNGELTVDEFCSGIREVAYSHAAVEFKRIHKQILLLRDQVLVLKDTISATVRRDDASAPNEGTNRLPDRVVQTYEPSLVRLSNERSHPQESTRPCTASTISNELRAIVAATVEETLRKILPEGQYPAPSATYAARPRSEPPETPAKAGTVASAPLDARLDGPMKASALDTGPGPNARAEDALAGRTESADPGAHFSSTDLRPTDPVPRPDAPLPCAVEADSCKTDGELSGRDAEGRTHAPLRHDDNIVSGSDEVQQCVERHA